MGDLESVFLVLVVVYCTECAFWVRRDAIAFLLPYGKCWRLVSPLRLFGPQTGGLLFGNPLPPLGTVFICHQWPVLLSPDAAYAYACQGLRSEASPNQEAIYLRFEDIRTVEASSKKVLINHEVFLTTGSEPAARYLAELLRQVSELPVGKRQHAIEAAVTKAMDVEEITERIEAFQQCSTTLRRMGNLLFLAMFVCAPLMVWWQGLSRSGPWLGLGSLTLMVMIVIEYNRAYKTLYPQNRGGRLAHLITMVLSPPLAIRAHDLLSQHVLHAYHPLAVAHVLCPSQLFRDMARRAWWDMQLSHTPSCRTDEPGPQATAHWFRVRLGHAMDHFLLKVGVPPEALLKPPTRTDNASLTYCPRCWCQYTITEGACTDCGGLPLQPFKDVLNNELCL